MFLIQMIREVVLVLRVKSAWLVGRVRRKGIEAGVEGLMGQKASLKVLGGMISHTGLIVAIEAVPGVMALNEVAGQVALGVDVRKGVEVLRGTEGHVQRKIREVGHPGHKVLMLMTTI